MNVEDQLNLCVCLTEYYQMQFGGRLFFRTILMPKHKKIMDVCLFSTSISNFSQRTDSFKTSMKQLPLYLKKSKNRN